MSIDQSKYIAELNQSYNDLGEDLLMLEAVLLARKGEAGFPEEYIASSLQRLREYACQHIEDIDQMTQFLVAGRHRGISPAMDAQQA